MRVLITGSNGQLGSEIRELAAKYKKLDFVFKDIPGLDINYNASYEIGDNYGISKEGLVNLREELTIIYATLYCWWCGAENIFWIGADGKGVEISELREMTSAISELKNLGINIKTLSETVYDIPFACHWNFYD